MRNIVENIKKLWVISFPMIVQGIVLQLQSLTDKAFLGKINSTFISALGASQFPLYASMDTLFALSTGLTIIVSRMYGAGKKEEINKYVLSNAVFASILSTIIFIIWYLFTADVLGIFKVDSILLEYCVPYIKICSFYFLMIGIDSSLGSYYQGIGNTKPIMICGITKVVANIIISYILIFGHLGFAAMGIKGAAIGTLLANAIASIAFSIYHFIINKKKCFLSIRSIYQIKFLYFREILSIGVPTALEYFLWNASNLVLMALLNGISYHATAIYTLTFGVEVIVFMVFDGNGKAALSLIGQGIGAKNKKTADGYIVSCILVNIVLVAFFLIIVILRGEWILGIFTNDKELISSTSPFLIFTGVIMLSKSMNIVAGNGIRANKDTKWMLKTQIIGSVCTVVLSFFLVKHVGIGVLGIYITLFVDETLRAIINFYYYLKKYSSIQWQIFLTSNKRSSCEY